MKAYDIHEAHRHSSEHRAAIERSTLCGCFYCRRSYASAEIVEWTDSGETALCPRCGIDSVVGDASGFPVADKDFLSAMRSFWFAGV